jgi:hypothetical protein
MLLAHFLYDFHWQGPFIAENKGRRIFLLFVHAITWTMLVSLPMFYFGNFSIVAFLFLFITHFFIDKWKAKQPKTDDKFYLVYIDQGFHFITIIIAYLIF